MRLQRGICLFILLALSSCSDDGVQPRVPGASAGSAFDRQVRENCDAVAAAAERYFEANGEYPWDESLLLPFLPQSRRLFNPETGKPTEPLSSRYWHVALDPPFPGSTGYRVIAAYDASGQMQTLGYYIVGRGEACDIIVTNAPADELALARDDAVVANCKTVAAAADSFAADSNGRYPMTTTDRSGTGLTLQGYLPGGELLENPYTGNRTEPQWDTGIDPGQTVYRPNHYENRFAVIGVGWKLAGIVYRARYHRDEVVEPVITPCGG